MTTATAATLCLWRRRQLSSLPEATNPTRLGGVAAVGSNSLMASTAAGAMSHHAPSSSMIEVASLAFFRSNVASSQKAAAAEGPPAPRVSPSPGSLGAGAG